MEQDDPPLVAQVLPDVSGLGKRFDYLVPSALRESVGIGSLVRIDLHGRRVGGWVISLADRPATGLAPEVLKSIAKITGHGPDREIVGLAEWAAERWVARRLRSLLATASPPRAVTDLPVARRTGSAPGPRSPATTDLLASGGGVLRLPPRADPIPSLLSAIAVGPTLAVVPGQGSAALLATRLRRAGVSVALLPTDWALAAAGVDIVIGTRAAAWGPCNGLAAAILLDEHDEALQEERSPTWHARDVLAERCRRADVALVMISPIPTLTAVETYSGGEGAVHPPPERERAGWPSVVVVDRRDEEPWKRSLLTSPLIERLRDTTRRVVCVSNITGRARVLACRSCRSLIRCERCDAAVGMSHEGGLECRRCGQRRPPVCQHCGSSAFANLRPGVTRLREELEGAAGRAVASVVGGDQPLSSDIGIHVGTEAVLHRVLAADVVAFLEFDSEMLAPRYRAAEQALALVVRAGRLAPEVLIQTFVPDHPVIRAAQAADPDIVLREDRVRRSALALPPYGALALLSGPALDDFVEQLAPLDVSIGGDGDRALVRAADWAALSVALRTPLRPDGRRLRIEVDPPRV